LRHLGRLAAPAQESTHRTSGRDAPVYNTQNCLISSGYAAWQLIQVQPSNNWQMRREGTTNPVWPWMIVTRNWWHWRAISAWTLVGRLIETIGDVSDAIVYNTLT
jgi:hypothetical protein